MLHVVLVKRHRAALVLLLLVLLRQQAGVLPILALLALLAILRIHLTILHLVLARLVTIA